nr:PREDICTED: spindle pole body protein pcp1-like [Linepithema humile]
MQTISLNECSTNIVENKVSQDATECDIVDHKIVTLHHQVAKLNEIIVNFEDVIQIKDTQLEDMRRKNARLLAELKKQQKYNRNLKQQLDDEKFVYQRKKNYFTEEMQRYRTKYIGNTSTFHQQWHKELEQAQDTLETENKQLREELADKNQITYNLCIKFLRMKHAKDTLRHKLDQLLHEHLLVMAEMMEKLDEARKELNLIVSEKFQEQLPLSKAKFLQVLQRNNRLMYENATLKVQVYQLTQNIEKLKNDIQRPKKINIDAKIIEKLSMQSNARSLVEKTERIVLLSKLSRPVDSEDVHTISGVSSGNVNKHTFDNIKDAKSDFEEFHPERARSAPGIVEAFTISQHNE